MPKIELWIIDERKDNGTQVIPDVAAVPPVGATLDTLDGTRTVTHQHYDFDEKTGDCRVHLSVN